MPFDGGRLSLLVRADADTNTGAGHFMRCLALAEACVARGGNATFLTRCESDALRTRAELAGVRVVPLTTTPGSSDDVAAVRAQLATPSEQGARWLVLDGYHFGPPYQRALRESSVRTVMVDDTAHFPGYDCDVLLNQNLDATAQEYAVEPGTVLLLGTRFALLRREFLPWLVTEKTIPRSARRLLVTLGSSDLGNRTQMILDGVRASGLTLEEIRVVVGPDNPHLPVLERYVASSGLPIRLLSRDVRMPEQMAWAQFAVSAAGSTAWELAFMRVPSLLLVVADNQLGVAREMDSHGAAENLGTHTDAAGVAAALQRLAEDRERRTQFGQRGRELVDGRGAERVLDVLRTLGTGGHGYRVLLRRATEQDALAFLRLANDPGVRAQAFHPERIELDAHMQWFGQKLASRESALWVIELGGVIAAQVRYDRTDDNAAEIGYAVASAFRGMGLGTKILDLTWRLACQVLGVSVVRGVVIRGNTASARAFEKAGFSHAGESEVHGRNCLTFERKVASPAGIS